MVSQAKAETIILPKITSNRIARKRGKEAKK